MNIPIYVEPLPELHSVPTEENIEWSAKRLHNRRPGGPSEMRARKKAKEEAAAGEETTEGNRGGDYRVCGVYRGVQLREGG